MTIYSDTSPDYSIYGISFSGYDNVALGAARALAQTGNIQGSIIAANLLIHRYKLVDLGFSIYDQAIQCLDKAIYNNSAVAIDARYVTLPPYLGVNATPLVEAKIAILDNKMRMIHHHPAIVKHPIDEALDLHEQILTLDPTYTSPEVAIMYDVTLGNHQRGLEEYKKFLAARQNYAVGGEGKFWLFDNQAMRFLIASLDNLLNGQPNNCNHPVFVNYIENHQISDTESIQFFCDAMNLGNKLRLGNYNQTSVQEFLTSHEVDYLGLLGTQRFRVTGCTIVSNLLAGKDPEFALKLLNVEAQSYRTQEVVYAIGDFQLEPVARLTGQENKASDFLPSECL